MSVRKLFGENKTKRDAKKRKAGSKPAFPNLSFCLFVHVLFNATTDNTRTVNSRRKKRLKELPELIPVRIPDFDLSKIPRPNGRLDLGNVPCNYHDQIVGR